LLTVLAVMNGFENEIQTRIAGTDAHVVFLGENTGGVREPGALVARLKGERGVLGVAPFTYVKAMVYRDGLTEGLVVKGVDLAAERSVTSIGQHIAVRLSDMFDAPRAEGRLMRALGTPGLRANNWIELNRNLFTWMKLEKAVMFVILALIVLVAAFNIVSTLFMVVLEKRRDIGVLK